MRKLLKHIFVIGINLAIFVGILGGLEYAARKIQQRRLGVTALLPAS